MQTRRALQLERRHQDAEPAPRLEKGQAPLTGRKRKRRDADSSVRQLSAFKPTTQTPGKEGKAAGVDHLLQYSHETALMHFAAKDPALLHILKTTQKKCPWDPRHITPEETHRTDVTSPASVFKTLFRTILYQQLSDKSASAIHRRIIALFAHPDRPTPQETIRLKNEVLRQNGLSERKAEYVKSLAAAMLDGTLTPSTFAEMSDDDIITQMTKIKGIGAWSAQMFLMFDLKRCNLFPVGDLAVRKAVALHFKHLPALQNGLGAQLRKGKGGKEGDRILQDIVETHWAPYKSLGSWAMWQSYDLTPSPASSGQRSHDD